MEIAAFVVAVPHDKHTINYEMAHAIYLALLLARSVQARG